MNGMIGAEVSPEAPAVLQEAAAKGDARSQARLGKIYQQGLGVVLNYELALAWFRKAAAQGNGEAEAGLGQMLEKGQGVDPDIQQALALYKKAFAHGNTQGQVFLGDLYLNGLGVDQSYRKALACYLSAAEKVRDPEGAALALVRMGAMHCQGRGMEKDLKQGFELYLRAAKLGNAEAQRYVGAMYRDGLGVARDHKKALAWFQKSAKEEGTPADRAMGDIYRDGLVVEKNIPEAMKWYEKAAARGDKYAKTELLKLLQKEYAQESAGAGPAPAGRLDAPPGAEAAGWEQPLPDAGKKADQNSERKRKAAEEGKVAPADKPLPAPKAKSAKPRIEKKTAASATPEPKPLNGRKAKAPAPGALPYLLPAVGAIVVALALVFLHPGKKTGRAPALVVPRTLNVAAPLPVPAAIPAWIPEIPAAKLEMSEALQPSPKPGPKTSAPVAAPVSPAAPSELAAIRLRGEYRTLDEGEVAAMLAAKKIFDARRNPEGIFAHRYEIRNAGGLSLVVDRATNLIWSRQQNPVRMNMEKTVKWIASLNQIRFGGSDRWRLPTVEEAAALLQGKPDGGKTFLAAVFGLGIGEIWTGDRFEGSGSWTVDFQDGMVKNAKNKSRLLTLMVSSEPDSASK